MANPHFDAARHLEARRGRLDQIYENASRQAWVYSEYQTYGMGEYHDENAIDFGIAFFNQPHMSHGVALAEGTEELQDGFFPQTTGGVYAWDQNEQGLYVGAFVFMTVVHDQPEDEDIAYTVEHHFTFSGVAMKDVSKKFLHL